MIQGVKLKELRTFPDSRGFVREILRRSDDCFPGIFGQWNHSLMLEGVVKAWHYHKIQTDLWYVCSGLMRVGLHDLREDSSTRGETMSFVMGDNMPARLLVIPPRVAHGCAAVHGPVHLFYFVTHEYNPSDEYRIPHNDPAIGFDWGEGLASPPRFSQ